MSIFSSSRDKELDNLAKATKPTPTNQVPTPTPVSTPSYTTQPTNTMNTSNITVIAEGTTMDGDMKIEGDVKIEGIVKGTITAKGKIVLGGSGKIEGDILCQHAEISGTITGKLKIADILFLKSNALVNGDINTGKLVMESGVKFNGNCVMGSINTVPTGSTIVSKPAEEKTTIVELDAN